MFRYLELRETADHCLMVGVTFFKEGLHHGTTKDSRLQKPSLGS